LRYIAMPLSWCCAISHTAVVVFRYMAVALPRYSTILGGMAREVPPEGKWVPVTVSLREKDVERLDVARGAMNRSEWARMILLAGLERWEPPKGSRDNRLPPVPVPPPPPPARRRKTAPKRDTPPPVDGALALAERKDAGDVADVVPNLAAELRASLQVASDLPKPKRCTHPGKRSVGGYCTDCDHLILPGGGWA
jgi:hypothetical protein